MDVDVKCARFSIAPTTQVFFTTCINRDAQSEAQQELTGSCVFEGPAVEPQLG